MCKRSKRFFEEKRIWVLCIIATAPSPFPADSLLHQGGFHSQGWISFILLRGLWFLQLGLIILLLYFIFAQTWPNSSKIVLSERIRHLKRRRISRWLGREIVVGLPPLGQQTRNVGQANPSGAQEQEKSRGRVSWKSRRAGNSSAKQETVCSASKERWKLFHYLHNNRMNVRLV